MTLNLKVPLGVFCIRGWGLNYAMQASPEAFTTMIDLTDSARRMCLWDLLSEALGKA